jgi:hypothetical protein
MEYSEQYTGIDILYDAVVMSIYVYLFHDKPQSIMFMPQRC